MVVFSILPKKEDAFPVYKGKKITLLQNSDFLQLSPVCEKLFDFAQEWIFNSIALFKDGIEVW